jgi:transposase InsO family protein
MVKFWSWWRVFSNEFSEFCMEHGAIHKRTQPYSPQSNEIAKRKNCTLTELVNTMLEIAGLSKNGVVRLYWSYVMS